MTHNFTENTHRPTICTLPLSIYLLLNLDQNRTYRLCVGYQCHEVKFTVDKHEQELMHIPSHLAKYLGLIQDKWLNIWRTGNQVCLGPVIGVLVNRQQIRRIRAKKFHQSIYLHFQANHWTHCLLYYFSIEDILWRTRQIKGYLYDPLHREWRHDWFPLPNVIYDRCICSSKQELALTEQTRQHLLGLTGISFINKGSLGKWELAKELSNFPELHSHLPVTLKYRNHTDIFKMLRLYGYIFLKSSNGYGGKEVLAIKQVKNCFHITFRKQSLITLTIKSKDKLKKLLKKFIKPKPYIVQQGIETLKLGKMHMDLRLLVQKNKQGIWKVTYNRARITVATNSIINSTLATTIVDYKQLVNHLQQYHMRHLPSEESINRLAITIVERIEQAFGSFGELGLDLIIDQAGNIWFIEANSKPTKKVNLYLEQHTGILDQFLSVLNYAKYLQKVKQSGKVQIKYLKN